MPSISSLLCLCLILSTQWNVGVAVENLSDDELNDAVRKFSFLLVFFCQSPCNSEDGIKMTEKVTRIADAVSALEIPVVQASKSAVKLGLETVPNLVFYRDSIPLVVDVDLGDIDEVVSWIERNKQSYVQQLDDSSFEHQTQASTGATTGDWLIQFYTPDCDELTPTWHAVASRFRHGKMYFYELPLKEVESYVTFAEGWYVNAPMKAVPKVATPFDDLIQLCVDFIRENSDHNSYIIGAMFVCFVVVTLFVIQRRCCRRRKSKLF